MTNKETITFLYGCCIAARAVVPLKTLLSEISLCILPSVFPLTGAEGPCHAMRLALGVHARLPLSFYFANRFLFGPITNHQSLNADIIGELGQNSP